MSQKPRAAPAPSIGKSPKPSLAGVHSRIRKRNIVHAFDPEQFRTTLADILARTHSNTDDFFREIGLKEEQLDFHRYSTTFFDMLLTGGTGAAEGKFQQGAVPSVLSFFGTGTGPMTDANRPARYEFVELVKQALRRKPFLERPLDGIISNLLESFVSFPEEYMHLSALLIGCLLAKKVIPGKDLAPLLNNDNVIASGAALRMLTEIFQTVVQESNLDTLMRLLLDAGLLPKLADFMPPAQRTQEEFERHFTSAGMPEFVEQVRRRQTRDQTAQIKTSFVELIKAARPIDEITARIQALRREAQIDDTTTLFMVWDAIFGAIEWSACSQQAPEQAVRQLQQFAQLLKPFVTTPTAQTDLLVKVQNHCYDDARCVKCFLPFVRILYDADVVEEDAVMYWFRQGSSLRGRSVFLSQLEPFVKWLETAEEEDEDEEDEESDEEPKPAVKPAAAAKPSAKPAK